MPGLLRFSTNISLASGLSSWIFVFVLRLSVMLGDRRRQERLLYLAGAAAAAAGAAYLVYRHLAAPPPEEAAAEGDAERDDRAAARDGRAAASAPEAGRRGAKTSIVSQAQAAKAEAPVRAGSAPRAQFACLGPAGARHARSGAERERERDEAPVRDPVPTPRASIRSLPGSCFCGACPVCVAQSPGHTPAPAVVGKKGTRWWYEGHKGMDRKAAIAAQQRAEQAAKEVTEQAMAAAQACLPTCPPRRTVGCQTGGGDAGDGGWLLERPVRARPCSRARVHAEIRARTAANVRTHARTYTRTNVFTHRTEIWKRSHAS